MRNRLLTFSLGMLCLVTTATAQLADSAKYNNGVWQMNGEPLSYLAHPEMRGWLCSFNWKDIEPADNVWSWAYFDSYIKARCDLPIMLMVFTKENSPGWLYDSAGVPRVIERNSNQDSVGFAPFFADSLYKSYFKRMIDTVANHIAAYPYSIRKNIVAIQACMGEEGDYIGYRGEDRQSQDVAVEPQYNLTKDQFTALFREFSLYYKDAYLNSDPKITLIINPGPLRQDNVNWSLAHCPNSWFKLTTLGKIYQANDELTNAAWLLPILNTRQNGTFVSGRSELSLDNLSKGGWSTHTPRNLFALFSSMIYWGMDYSNQPPTNIQNPTFTPAFNFFNKYAEKKDTINSFVAMCALRDGLDAGDSKRFPSKTKGAVKRNNSQRYIDIKDQFSSYGARIDDINAAMGTMSDNIDATGINDVGWKIFPGNYERYLHQLKANNTSAGYWNVDAPNDTNSIYGRFARGFDLANGKDVLNFDVDNGILNNTAIDGKYPVVLSITYLDKGQGSWQLFYDAQGNMNKPSLSVDCANSGQWKTVSVILRDAYFDNRSSGNSDFRIQNTGSENVIFALVEFERPNADSSNVGFSASPLAAFDTLCVDSTSNFRSFVLNGGFLDNSPVTVGPLPGYQFAFADSAYTDSLIISGYNTSFIQRIYVRLSSAMAASYSGNIPVSGGGIPSIGVPVTGTVVNSRPDLSAVITNITCNNAKDGLIDLTANGGIGPFTYSWTSSGSSFKASDQDIFALLPATYSVTVGSYAGCKTSASFVVTQPDRLTLNLSADSMVCKGGSTIVHVTAAGGTAPYTGTGNFSVIAGRQTFTVIDAHGCSDTASITVNNGVGIPPDKPGSILGALADATGLCGGGTFTYSINPVARASSYTWTPPKNCSISSVSADGTQITLSVPSGFNSGSLSVIASNTCGSSTAQSKSLSSLPVKPNAVSGPTLVLPLQLGLVYSVPPVIGLTYTWAVPSGAKIIAGQNTPTIIVNWGNASGNINVKAVNACGSSTNAILGVSVTSNTLTASVSALPPFDTVCMNGLSTAKSFALSGSGLSGSNVIVGPLNGYKISSVNNGPYSDSLVISNYGTSFNQTVYVKFNPATAASYNGNIGITGGGAASFGVSVSGIAVNSSPGLSANVTNITCNALKNGAVDLSTNGGMGPFTYSWVSSGSSFKDSVQDISNLSPATYVVTVSSYAGCKTSAEYMVVQPDPLILNLSADSMICKGGTTTVHVTATGGTAPYTGIGNFGVIAGKQNFTVTDAHGCATTQSITVNNGIGVPPDKPVSILGALADATGLCGGGMYNYSIGQVATASSYTWAPPAGSSINSVSGDGTQITLNVPSNFSTGTLSVTANNICGNSVAQTKPLTSIPAKPGSVSGPTSVIPLQTGLVYSVPPVTGLNYTWTVPSGARIISGQNTFAITVTWGNTSGNVTVKAVNACGGSSNTTLGVTVASNMLTSSVSVLPAFDTLCMNGLSTSKSFTVSGSSLSGSNVIVGPLNGYKFSTANNGTYADSLVLSNYGIALNQVVYVKFSPTIADVYNGGIPISGGGAASINVSVNGVAVNSSPALSASVINISCNNAKNGSIDLSTNGGTGVFTYSWVSSGSSFKDSVQDIVNLSPATYTVTVGSYAGCKISAGYTVTQPDPLVLNLSADSMTCKGSTTVVHATASGGTAPYSGTGNFVVIAGRQTFTVTDAHGCSITQSITVNNGAGIPPDKPVSISGASADATGLCGGGSFTYSVTPVATASSYTWTPPAGCNVASVNGDGTQLILSVPSGFSAGTLSVTANNICGSSIAQTKALTAIAAKPGNISGPSSVAPLQLALIYSVPPVLGLTYTWALPSGAKIVAGQGTSTIIANWGTTSGNINVKAVNDCGSSSNTILGVTVASSSAAQQNTRSDLSAIPGNLVVMPNPVQNIAHLSFIARHAHPYAVTVTDMEGKLLLNKNGVAFAGENKLDIDVHSYPNGAYIVTLVNNNGERKRVKLIKKK